MSTHRKDAVGVNIDVLAYILNGMIMIRSPGKMTLRCSSICPWFMYFVVVVTSAGGLATV